MKMNTLFIFFAAAVMVAACKKEDPVVNDDQQIIDNGGLEVKSLVFKVKFDPNQARLDNFGNPAVIPTNHGTQTPSFSSMSAHYIELTPDANTQLGDGEIIYQGAETVLGGSPAVSFDDATLVQDGEVIYSIPLADVAAGTYSWARVSLTYQNFDINFKAFGTDASGSVASFVGFNTYINSHLIKTLTDNVNGNKEQGYWAFETHPNQFVQTAQLTTGQSDGTTVVNPLSATSPIPVGSCVVTGQFANALEITGNETENIVVELSFSVNNSFEWKDDAQNNIFEPLDGDTIVDMGIRGLIPSVLP